MVLWQETQSDVTHNINCESLRKEPSIKFGARLSYLATWLGMLAAVGGMLPFSAVGVLVSAESAAFAAPRTQSAPPDCELGWEQGFPAEGTVYTDPLTGCTGVYEIVIGDRVIVPGRGEKEVFLAKAVEFPNRLCWATTTRYGESVEHCDSYTITGGATVGAGGGVTVGADAGVVFASAKAEMEVTYTAEFSVGGGWTDSKCETYSWQVESPHPSCYILSYRVFAVGGSGSKFGLSIEEWAGGVGAGCDMAWVDRVLPDLEPIVVVEGISE